MQAVCVDSPEAFDPSWYVLRLGVWCSRLFVFFFERTVSMYVGVMCDRPCIHWLRITISDWP